MIKKTGRVYICPTMLAQTQFPVLHMEVQQKGDGSFIVQWGKGESKRKLVIFPSHASNMAKKIVILGLRREVLYLGPYDKLD